MKIVARKYGQSYSQLKVKRRKLCDAEAIMWELYTELN